MLEKLYDKLNGFRPGGVYYIAGRPAIGKTTLMLNIARNYAEKLNRKALIFSIEMSKEEVLHRISGEETNLSVLPLYISDDLMLTPSKVKEKIDVVKPDIVFIDYLELIEADTRSSARVFEITEICYSLKRIAKSANIPVVILSQLGGRGNDRPKLPDALRHKGSIEQDCDVIMFLYDSDYASSPHRDFFDIEIIVAKNRWGETFTLNSRLDLSTLRYTVCENE